MNKKDWIIIIFVNIFNLTLAFAAGWFVHARYNPPELELPILSQAQQIVSAHYLYDLPDNPTLEYGMIRGMMRSLDDPYAAFFEPPQQELNADRLEGSFGGIGVTLERDAENYYILYPFPDSPAQNEGILDGDRLVRADDLEITPETPIDQVIAAVRGPEGQRVTIIAARPPTYELLEFKIKRANISTPTVTWHLSAEDPRIGVFKVNLIAASTPEEIEKAIADLQSQGATHFVMDLRGNGGGLLVPGVDIARLFLDDGMVIYEQYNDQQLTEHEVKKRGALSDIPLVILVDHNTASAAEIIAGALQSHDRAVLIGAPTYGKDTVQLIFNLDDGSSIHITGGKWWTLDGSFDAEDASLLPDVTLEPGDERVNPGIEEAVRAFFGE